GSTALLPGAPSGDGWSGTVVIRRVAEATLVESSDACCKETRHKLLNEDITITLAGGRATANVSYRSSENVIRHAEDEIHSEDITVDEVTAGSGSDSRKAKVQITLSENGNYEIEYASPSVDGIWKQDGHSIIMCKA